MKSDSCNKVESTGIKNRTSVNYEKGYYFEGVSVSMFELNSTTLRYETAFSSNVTRKKIFRS
jgi:hypothetical protein